MDMPRFKKLDLTFSKLREIVTTQDKKRYTLVLASSVTEPISASTETPNAVIEETPPSSSIAEEESNEPSDYLIRAAQGHTIPISSESLQLTPLLPQDLPIAVHGTFYPSYEAIIASGYLSRMERNHIHLATAETGVVSGIRKNAEVLVFVDVQRAVDEGGVKFWMSTNGVVLTEGDAEGRLGLEYVNRIVDRKNGLGVLWQGGEVVTELPVKLRGRGIQVAKRGRAQMRGKNGKGGEGRGGAGKGREKRGGEEQEREFDPGDL